MSGEPEERAEEAAEATPAPEAVPAAEAGPDAGAPVTEAAEAEAVAPDEAAPDDAPDPALLADAVRIAEALIFASDRPVTAMMLAPLLPEGVTGAVAIATLAELYEGRGVALVEVAGGWAFRTAPDLAPRLTKVVQAPRRLPRAAMEALSVIAYHQPCTRGEIEEIRGAALAQTTLEALLELGLIAPRGRREVPGRPTLWGTTPKFLEQFGLKALSDLPRKEELVTGETAPALPLEAAPPSGNEAGIAPGEAPAPPGDEPDPAAEEPPPAPPAP
jgi:segregation and condensation protein B